MNDAGYVYLLSGGGYYKIGRTTNIDKRITQIAPKLPFETELIHYLEVDNASAVETFLHERFADCRQEGEWFILDQADVDWFLQWDGEIDNEVDGEIDGGDKVAIIHVRLRDGYDDDIMEWYDSQDSKSDVVRRAIRSYIRLQNEGGQEAAVRNAVIQALNSWPAVIEAAVQEAFANYQFSLAPARAPGEEDPELAARLDAQLDNFFEE